MNILFGSKIAKEEKGKGKERNQMTGLRHPIFISMAVGSIWFSR